MSPLAAEAIISPLDVQGLDGWSVGEDLADGISRQRFDFSPGGDFSVC